MGYSVLPFLCSFQLFYSYFLDHSSLLGEEPAFLYKIELSIPIPMRAIGALYFCFIQLRVCIQY